LTILSMKVDPGTLTVDAKNATIVSNYASICRNSPLSRIPPPHSRPDAVAPRGSASRPRDRAAHRLTRDRRGNQQVYRANTHSPIFTELASILRKTSGVVDVLANALGPVAERVRVAFVFGSVARGQESAGSDVDLMLIGDLGFREAVTLLHPTQAEIGREVNPKVFAIEEFCGKLQSDPFLADVMSKPKLFVVGNAHDLEELARHQSR
jgi:predicted nucleotidyltransferase